jgi:tetratricopeptide (TPR) repeat protein
MDINLLKYQSHLYLQQENFADAISFYEQCINEYPDLVYAYWYLGLFWLLQGDAEQCHNSWLLALTNTEADLTAQDFAEFLELLKNQAQEYISKQKPELAQAICEAILAWDNSQVEVYYYLAESLALQGNLEEAIAHWETVISIQPDWVDAYLQPAYIWQKLENFYQAIACYLNSLAIQPDYFTFYQLGLCYTHLSRWELAIDCFQNSIQIQPDYAPAYSDLAFALMQMGEVEAGIANWRKAIIIQPQFFQKLIHISETGTIKAKLS